MKTFLLSPFLLVSSFVIGLSPAASATHALALGPNGVDGADLTGDAARMRGEVHSVWLGTHGVAVWMARRTYDRYGIDGVKFAADGHALGAPVPLVEGTEPGLDGSAETLGLSASGNELLLVWQNFTTGVLARRMSSDLSWLDAAPVVLKSRPGYDPSFYYRMSLAANPQRHGVVIVQAAIYSALSVAPVLTFARLGPSSAPAPEIFTVETPDTDVIFDAAVAARADGFLITWLSGGADNFDRVQARTTGLAGVTTGPVHLLTTPLVSGGQYPGPHRLAAAPLGDGSAVAWSQFKTLDGSGTPELSRHWTRVDAGGAPVGVAQELFPVPASSEGSYAVNLQSVSGGVLALSGEKAPDGAIPHQRVIRRFLSADGTAGTVAPFGEVQAMLPEVMNIHTTGGGALVVGEVRAPEYYSSLRAAVAAPLTAGYTWGQPSKVLSAGSPEQQACAVACRGTDYLVVWQDGRDGHTLASEVRGRFFALDGSPAGASFRISNRAADDISPAVAASGGKYLVAWCGNDVFSSNDDVWAAFVTAPGNVSAPIPVATLGDRQENGVSVAGGANGGFFVAWRGGSLDYLPVPQYDDIYGTWIEPGGTVTIPNGFVISDSPGKERAVSVAGGTGTYGLVWREGGSSSSNVYGAVVPGNPVAVPASPERLTFTVGDNAHAPEIAWNGSHYRAVWRDARSGYHIKSATMSETGTLGTVTTVAENTLPLYEPAIVPSGNGWQIFWHELVTRTSPGIPYIFEGRVSFASMDAAGQITNIDRFAPRFIDPDTLTAASSPDGGVFIVYPTPQDLGKETARTGSLETVLFYPNRPPADPQFAIESSSPLTTLRWKADPWFPRDAGAVETATNLPQWAPLLQYPPAIPAQGTGNDAMVIFPSLPGTRHFFRLNSNVPGPP